MAFFTTAQRDGKWHLIDPNGKPFYSLGVDCVIPSSTRDVDLRAKYGGGQFWYDNWAKAKLDQLKQMNFNTLAAWHDRTYWGRGNTFPKTIEIRMSQGSTTVNPGWGLGFPDVFCPSFEKAVHNQCLDTFFRNGGRVLIDDESVIGWYTGNELHWWGSGGYWGNDDQGTGSNSTGLVDDYIRLSPDRVGKQKWVKFIAERYGSIDKLNKAWDAEYLEFDDLLHIAHYRAAGEHFEKDKQDFLRLIAQTYFRITSEALKLYAPNHLNLGCRVVGISTPRIVLEEMAKVVDVVTINFYSMELLSQYLDYLHDLTKKPIMITEFCFCAGRDAGFLINTNGARNVLVANQARRGELYRKMTHDAAAKPYMVGSHWFALYDYGGTTGLVGNYGLLTCQDEPWPEIMAAVTSANADLKH